MRDPVLIPEVESATTATATDAADEPSVASPFTVIVDTREQAPYLFRGLRANADQDHALIRVPTVRATLETGDYSIYGLASLVTVERKSKEDLYASIAARRDNFEERMKRLCLEFSVAAVVVESELSDLILNPPPYTRFDPKALNRTILGWMVRWPRVHWLLCPGRDAAEAQTYRFLERFWHAFKNGRWFDAERYAESEAGRAMAAVAGDDAR